MSPGNMFLICICTGFAFIGYTNPQKKRTIFAKMPLFPMRPVNEAGSIQIKTQLHVQVLSVVSILQSFELDGFYLRGDFRGVYNHTPKMMA